MTAQVWRLTLQRLLSHERMVIATGQSDSRHPLPRTAGAVGGLCFVWLLAGLVRGSCVKV